ncbi:MAG TPA: hypothetical protein VML19_13130 [Verrucomicrobiae bacterium]|nr:hypothetical protein [Verrucomicrobiae bacterium]
MAADDIVELELMRHRFERLMSDLKRGMRGRNSFQAWEVDLILDLESCQLEKKRRKQLLRQYERAVQRQMDSGPGPPMKLSEYLQRRTTRRPSSR